MTSSLLLLATDQETAPPGAVEAMEVNPFLIGGITLLILLSLLLFTFGFRNVANRL